MSMSNEIGILLYCYSFAHALVGLLVSRKGRGTDIGWLSDFKTTFPSC